MTFFSQLLSAAENDSTYGSVIEIKVWPTYFDIYLNVKSVCGNNSQTNRYILGKEETESYSILLAAMTARMVTNLNYDCRSDGVAVIYGVRVKPEL